MRYRKKIWQAVVVSALVGSLTVVPVYAEPSDTVQELQGEQSDLEDQKSDAQSELNSLQTQLEGLLSKISELEDNLVQKGEEIRQAKKDLAAAEERRQEQYDSLLEEWRDGVKIEVDEKAWDKIDFNETGVTIITPEAQDGSDLSGTDESEDTQEGSESEDGSSADGSAEE